MNQAEEDALILLAMEPSDLHEAIRRAIRAAVAHERERCAKIADAQAWSHQNIGDIGPEMNSTAIAAAIRRGE